MTANNNKKKISKEKKMQNVLKRKNRYLEGFQVDFFPLKSYVSDHSESIDINNEIS